MESFCTQKAEEERENWNVSKFEEQIESDSNSKFGLFSSV